MIRPRSGTAAGIIPFFSLILLFLSLPSSLPAGIGALGDNTRYLPLDHPVYDFLDRLQERGRLNGLNPSLRPYTRLQVIEAVEKEKASGLRSFELRLIETIRTECAVDIQGASAGDSAGINVITRFEASQELGNIRPDRSLNTIGAGFGGRFSHLVFDCRFLRAPQFMEVSDTTSLRDPDVLPPLEEGLIRPMEGYLKGDFRLFGGAFSTEIFYGRMARNWSPALDHSLILGSRAMSFDHLALTLRSRHLTFSHLMASLDGMSYRTAGKEYVRAHRFLSAHRLDIRIRDHIRFGITETAVYGGENRGFDMWLANPFTSFRLAAIQNKIDHANNSFIALDGWYNIRNRLTLFGQFLFDDFLRDKDIQNRWALDLGLNFRDIPGLGPSTAGVRATVVSSFAYNTFQPYERYIISGRPLGAPLGNDYWSLGGFFRYFLSGDCDLKLHI
ncbi:MAG: capsule assembly Wzi family protein, partial [Gemmatimonadota bacterium]|nr:capsule assembly Wzi family protein [Gemmatimonadota bacterium]